MFGADNEYLIDSSDDDPSVRVCDGWGAKEWIGHLRGKARLCQAINKEQAKELFRQADVLERRLKRTEANAQHFKE